MRTKGEMEDEEEMAAKIIEKRSTRGKAKKDAKWIREVSANYAIRGAIASEIYEFLWLGRGAFAFSSEWGTKYLRKANISHVLTVANDTPDVRRAMIRERDAGNIKYLCLDVGDFGTDAAAGGMSRFFASAFEFVDSAKESRGRVFVHCANGSNRSPTLCVAYCVHRGLSLNDAYAHVLSMRPHVQPLKDNRQTLLRWYKTLPDHKHRDSAGDIDFDRMKRQSKKAWKRANVEPHVVKNESRKAGNIMRPFGIKGI